MKMTLPKLNMKKKIEQIILNRRKAYHIRDMQDFIKKQRKLPFVKEIVEDDKVILIKLKGIVDSSSIPLITSKSRKKMPKDHHIVLDFKEVKHIDSATLGALAMTFFELKKAHKKLAVINATSSLKNYINILQLNHIVKIFNSKKAALENLS